MKKGSPSLFSYPTNQHECGDCASVAKPERIFCLLHPMLEPNGKQWSRAVYEIILTVSVYELGCKDNGEIGRRLWFLNPQRKQKVSLWCRSGQTRRVSCFLHHTMRGSCGKHRRRRRRWERNSFNCLLLHFFFFFVFDGVYPVGSTWAKRGTRGGVGWRKRRTIKQKWIFSSSSFANQEQ